MEKILQREKRGWINKQNKLKKERTFFKDNAGSLLSSNCACIKISTCKIKNSPAQTQLGMVAYIFLVPLHSLDISKGNSAAVVCTVVNQEAVQTPRPSNRKQASYDATLPIMLCPKQQQPLQFTVNESQFKTLVPSLERKKKRKEKKNKRIKLPDEVQCI